MKCPHCKIEFHGTEQQKWIANDKEASWTIVWYRCPSCELATLNLVGQKYYKETGSYEEISRKIIHPQEGIKFNAPIEVPLHIANDFNEASRVFEFSKMSASALARRCLQNIIREAIGIEKPLLSDAIQSVIDSGKLPPHISDALDMVKTTANFEKYPEKSSNPSAITDVDNVEAEWLLDVLEVLFDFYYVQPEIIRKKKESLNTKFE
jgi:hypothetical protein